MSPIGPKRRSENVCSCAAVRGIVLQKSKVAAGLIFGEDLKREDIGDSYSLSRATEVACEFSVWR
jgi:hypothetical protein